MKQFFLTLLCVLAIRANGQDTTLHRTVTQQSSLRVRLDTNKVVYDEQGKALHFYQYEKLLNTGDYTMRLSGSPLDPATKRYLKKMSDQEKNAQFAGIKERMAIKSPVLQEGLYLNTDPLKRALDTEELDGKVIVLIFWAADCPPCTESFAGLNDFLKQIHNPEDLLLLAITPDEKTVADAKLKEKPLLYAQLLSNARAIANDYQLSTYPSFVVADKSHVIRYAISGSSSITLPMLKSTIKAVLFQ